MRPVARSFWILVAGSCLAGCAELANLDAYGAADPTGGGGSSSAGTGGSTTTGVGGDAGGGGGRGGGGGAGGVICVAASCDDYAALLECDGAVAHWPLDEQSGSNAKDVINGNDGSYIGGTAQGFVGAFGYSLQVDGTDAKYVTIPSGGLEYDATGAFTVELWFRTSNLDQGSPGRGMFSHFSGSIPQSGWALTLVDFASGIAHVEAETTGGASESTTAVTEDAWHHLVGVFKGQESVQVYLDGVAADPQAVSRPLTAPGEDLLLGCRRNTNGTAAACFEGRIDEVAIYDYGLSLDRISMHAACLR
jgi:hypothetical protein